MPTYIEKHCEHCSKAFNVPVANKHQIYCSRLCADEHKKLRCRTKGTCPNCGVEFEYLKSWPRKYCSNICAGKANIKNMNPFAGSRYMTSCEQCGVSYETVPSSSRGRFCSLQCFGKWKSVNQTGRNHPNYGKHFGRPSNAGPIVTAKCLNCEKEFVTKASHKNRRRTCSKECFGAYLTATGFRSGKNNGRWKGGHINYYGPSWTKAKREARKRDKVCQDCGKESKGRALDVHHIIPFRKFGVERHEEANVLSNLVALCNVCHLKRDWAIEKAEHSQRGGAKLSSPAQSHPKTRPIP